MHLDVGELREFYTSPLGAVVRRLLRHRLRARWRKVSGQTVVGLGYATPYLSAYREEAARLVAFMPAAQGALVWPRKGPKHTVLVDETALPLVDACVDRLLVVHGLEGAERVRPFLREIWRVLAPEGRVTMIVPNRRSIWARAESTPFAYGRPYSRRQLDALLVESMLSPVHWTYGLFVPPVERAVILRSAVAIERIGSRIWPGIGGVMLVEARKEMVAPTGKLQRARAPGGFVMVPNTRPVARGPFSRGP